MTLLNFEIAWRISFFVIMAYENSLQGVLQGIFKPDTPPQDKLHGIVDFKNGVQDILRDHV
jgi:hypothetical protein